jgi:malonyl-CoA/methylmalonyl-CoA synthetase
VLSFKDDDGVGTKRHPDNIHRGTLAMSDAPANTQDFFPKLNEANRKVALVSQAGSCTYADLSLRVHRFASGLLCDKPDLSGERIAFLVPASLDYVTALLGIWRAGGIAVPLNVSSALPELEHALSSVGVSRLIADSERQEKLQELCSSMDIQMSEVDALLLHEARPLPTLPVDRRAMILFTSGTTNKPKGVTSTHKNVRAQIDSLISAWAWQEDDIIPLVLPLHHIHGIINVLCCGLWSGATIHLFPKFELTAILPKVAEGAYTVFMAVPTIYVKLIEHLEHLREEDRASICNGFQAMRLNVSGSAACPVNVFHKWFELTGQTLLERYGMTEIGMGLSNPYEGERRAGAVGIPLPGVEVGLFRENNEPIAEEGIPGEIRIKGPTVFLEYWNDPEATRKSFRSGWFCTGDVAVIEKGYYRIMGRASVDIIKSGGYKLSALEIEGALLNHEKIQECAVLGVPDETWGEAVTAFVVLKSGAVLSLEELRAWCKDRMSHYKIPKDLKVLKTLPRNAMGKVAKPALRTFANG